MLALKELYDAEISIPSIKRGLIRCPGHLTTKCENRRNCRLDVLTSGPEIFSHLPNTASHGLKKKFFLTKKTAWRENGK